ncbi:hypothetical protein [Bradyrhizobium sp. CCBAU 53415]|uniref:hypothetical protein n=1 Tax=Bradyrhizobium sp. CCBAU 53415 TaxID=1325119 RepID=UPI0023066999|nr:hypothetical protein [Bradyrhizobium sp. CCBAU 53415]MDA9469630.1 hypothetical protein [Bradyrhizobium sp. CCBAU 53415]
MAKRRSRLEDDEDDDNSGCEAGDVPASAHAWGREPWPGKLQAILDALEIDALDDGSRLYLQRQLYIATLFNEDRTGHVILTLRCITESEGNSGALSEMHIRAVSGAIGPYADRGLALIEAFDQISLVGIFEQMRALEYFYEKEATDALERILRHKLRRALDPTAPELAPPPTKQERLAAAKARAAAARLATVERNIDIGRQMAALRDMTPCNKKFGRLRAKQFDFPQRESAEMLRVARIYGDRPEFYRITTWPVLVELSAPGTPPALRRKAEARIAAGERVTGAEIIRAR